ncbi:hypothetical protein BaRGS_00022119 [Batillaria attramentaria]|uniref:Uncharacterized protein n=1 Tax=Batillaria attramentaria TaxID=370345 RepID=A0ABD0KHV7_9CAEN
MLVTWFPLRLSTAVQKASACYGTHQNFLEIDCSPTMRVDILAIKNGAKKLSAECPLPTDETNYKADCCHYSEGDCLIESINTFPMECHEVSYCTPRATWADTTQHCNGNVYPSQTHYTEITFKCVQVRNPPKEITTTATTSSVTNTTVTYPNDAAGRTQSFEPPTNGTTASLNTTVKPVAQTGHVAVVENPSADTDSFTPAMIGGMIAGIIGLMLTIFIFMFYWGRKRQVRITGGKPPQSSVWDFLLANTMSVRAFRGYDNFSSTRTTASHSSEESGSPVIRKTVWLPNISLDSGHGDTVVTSDDNCSIFTTDGTLPSTSNRL